MAERTKSQTKEIAYIIMASISLVMYIFGHSTEAGVLPFPDKLFYYPCAITFAIAITIKGYWHFDKADKVFSVFLFLTFLFSVAIGDVIWLHLISCILGFLIFRQLKNVDISFLMNVLFYLTPLTVLIHYVFTSPFSYAEGYRYGGFQGDPNCFSMAMNILVYSSGYILLHSKHSIKRVIALINIASIAPLVFASASRSGVLCLLFLVGISVYSNIKKHLLGTVLILSLAVVFGGSYLGVFGSQIENTVSRFFNSSDSDRQSFDYRFQEFEIAINLLGENPEYLLCGIGFSQSVNAHKNFSQQYYHGGRAHNTYMSVLMEQGIVGFVLFIWFLIDIGLSIWHCRSLDDGWMRVVLYGALLLFIFTIFSLPFLPFWFALYLAQNFNISHL